MTLVRKNFYITPEQVEYLIGINKLTISEHIRRAIDEYIERLKNLNVSASQSQRKEGN